MPKLIPNRFPGGTMTKQALRCIALGAICLTATLSALTEPLHAAPAAQAGKTRTYYVAADEVNWDYAPSGRDEAMGMPFDDVAKGFVETSADHIGRVYKKAIYHEYTDATFTTIKPRAPQDAVPGHPRADPVRRSRRHHQGGLQEQRHASLQHASPRRPLSEGL